MASPGGVRRATSRGFELFKNLNDAQALRQSELTKRFFDDVGRGPESDALGLYRVSCAIRQALSAMEKPTGAARTVREKRHATIIRRCEFEGAPHKQVASDLGIGMRHFYRELRLARASFLRRLQLVTVKQEPHNSGVVDLFELQLQRVRALVNAGEFERAARSAEAVLEAVGNGDGKLIVLTLLAEAHAESRDLDALHSLERTVLEMSHDRRSISHAAISARLRTLQARAEYLDGSLDKASALCGPQLFRQVRVRCDPRERAMWASSLFEGAAFHALIGDYKSGTPQVLLGRDLADETENASPRLRFRALAALADLHLTDGEIAEAKLRLKQAYQIAADHNLVSAAFDATFLLAIAEWVDGKRDSALKISREAIQAARDSGLVDKPWYLITAAKIEVACQHAASEGARRALTFLSEVRSAGSKHTMRMYMAQAMAAECYLTQGCYAQAGLNASAALGGFRKIGVSSGLAYALRVAAEVEEGIGNLGKARECILESVELLERDGHPRSLHKALEIAGRLTKSSRYTRRARELMNAPR